MFVSLCVTSCQLFFMFLSSFFSFSFLAVLFPGGGRTILSPPAPVSQSIPVVALGLSHSGRAARTERVNLAFRRA